MQGSNTTEFILERIHSGWQINAWLCSAEGTVLAAAVEQYESGYRQMPDRTLIDQLSEKCHASSYPVVFMEEDMVYYLAFLDEENRLYLMGPIATENLGFSQSHAYRLRHGIPEQSYQIPYIPPVRALTCLSLAYFMVTGQMITEKTLMQENEAAEKLKEHEYAIYQLQQDSEEKRRFSYRNEQKWLAQIENGTLQEQQVRIDRESLQKLERVGHLALNNSFKQYEYMVISQICLVSRAAMRGGMNTFEAYTLSDMYYQKVSQCSDVMELLNICLQVERDFSERVRMAKQQEQEESYIEQCKNYIVRHRTKKFTVNEMARDLGLSRSYLSRQFSAHTGVTIQEYALQKRLEAAANMLRFSEEQIGTISEYLCFHSQSYFTERFRKQYGITPNEYRRQNKVIDFYHSESGNINDNRKEVTSFKITISGFLCKRYYFKGGFCMFEGKAFNSRIKSANVQNSERWLGYFAGPGMLYIAYFVVSGTYLNVFYTDVLKMSGIWGGLFLTLMPIMSKIVDCVTNIAMGRIIDKTKNRQGKARPWVLISGVFVAAAGILLYSVPNSSDTVKIWWVIFSYNLYFAFAFTIYNMSHTLMVPLSTRNTRQRDGLALFNNMGTAMLPGALVYMLFPMLALPWMGTNQSRWLTVMTVFSVIAIPAVLIEYYFTKERITEENEGVRGDKNEISLKQQMSACIKNKYWIIIIVFWLVWQIYNNWQATSLVYYCNWVLGTYNDGFTQTILNAVGQAPLGFGVFLLWPIAKKLGKRNTMMFGMILSMVGALIGWLQPHSMGIVLISLVIRSLGLLPTYLMAAMLAEALDHVEWKNGFRCDGFSASIVSITVTLGMGVAIGLFNLGLGQSGYVAPAADGSWVAQSSTVQGFLNFGYFGYPLITFAIVFVLMIFFDVEKQITQIQADIVARHKAEAEARGEVYLSFEEKARLEQEEQDRIAEQKRLEELKEKCTKKGLSFEEEERKYQEKSAAQRAKEEARAAKNKK